MSAKEDRLNKLKDAANKFIDWKRKILNAEYDFLDHIQQVRGASKIDNQNSSKASEIFVKSMQDYLTS